MYDYKNMYMSVLIIILHQLNKMFMDIFTKWHENIISQNIRGVVPK